MNTFDLTEISRPLRRRFCLTEEGRESAEQTHSRFLFVLFCICICRNRHTLRCPKYVSKLSCLALSRLSKCPSIVTKWNQAHSRFSCVLILKQQQYFYTVTAIQNGCFDLSNLRFFVYKNTIYKID